MFTGIVESIGTVRSISPQRLVIDVPPAREPWKLGESVAVDGVCLTLVSAEDGLLFEMSEETLARTSLGDLKVGGSVNLERAMKADGRFGGHIVQGHVDAVGTLEEVTQMERSHVLRFKAPDEYSKYLIDKGSVTVNGISLTVVNPRGGAFEVAIIPHTWLGTTLNQLEAGSSVNLEFDVIAKYVESLMKR